MLVANDNRRPSWRRRVGACFILALGATVFIFECVAAFQYMF